MRRRLLQLQLLPALQRQLQRRAAHGEVTVQLQQRQRRQQPPVHVAHTCQVAPQGHQGPPV
jgi:hypothetical protein